MADEALYIWTVKYRRRSNSCGGVEFRRSRMLTRPVRKASEKQASREEL